MIYHLRFVVCSFESGLAEVSKTGQSRIYVADPWSQMGCPFWTRGLLRKYETARFSTPQLNRPDWQFPMQENYSFFMIKNSNLKTLKGISSIFVSTKTRFFIHSGIALRISSSFEEGALDLIGELTSL